MTRDDDEPTAAERARAASLARLVDDLLSGEPTPAALDADDRAFLETAALIRSASASESPSESESESGSAAASASASASPRRRWLLLSAVAALAAAAVLISLLRPSSSPARLPAELRSRSADALVGPIDPSGAADGGRRTDLVYADRLASYRLLSLGSRGGRP